MKTPDVAGEARTFWPGSSWAVDPVAEALFEEGLVFLTKARRASNDGLILNVEIEPGLAVDEESAYGLARRFLEKALARGWRPDDGHALLARCHVGAAGSLAGESAAENLEKARTHLAACRQEAVRDPEILLALAEALEALGEPGAARAVYERCAKDYPDELRAHLGAALLLVKQDPIDEVSLKPHYAAIRSRPELLERYTRVLRDRFEVDDVSDPEDVVDLIAPAAAFAGEAPACVWVIPKVDPLPSGRVEGSLEDLDL
jgi:tetratricopeptide (TPR) repeat protein